MEKKEVRQKNKEERRLMEQHKRNGDFIDSPIRYGTVLVLPINYRVARHPFLSLFSRKPQVDITNQLMDDNTVVYG